MNLRAKAVTVDDRVWGERERSQPCSSEGREESQLLLVSREGD